jgi:hypothetical protein
LRGEKFAIAEVWRKLEIGREEPTEIAKEDFTEDAKAFIIKENDEDSALTSWSNWFTHFYSQYSLFLLLAKIFYFEFWWYR